MPHSLTENVAREFARHVDLLVPRMGWYRGHYQLGRTEIRVDGQVADPKPLTQPQVKLLELSEELKRRHAEFVALESDKGDILNQFSKSFGASSIRQVSLQAADGSNPKVLLLNALIGAVDSDGSPVYDYTRDTQSVLCRFTDAARRFVEDWPSLTRDMERHCESHVWARVKDKLPTQEALPRKFYLQISRLQIALDDPDQYVRATSMQAAAAGFEELVGGLREQLGKALSDLDDLIKADGRVSTKSFNPVRAAIAQFQMFSWAFTPDILETIARLEARLDITTPKNLDSVTAHTSGFSEFICKIRDDAIDATHVTSDVQSFGRAHRELSL